MRTHPTAKDGYQLSDLSPQPSAKPDPVVIPNAAFFIAAEESQSPLRSRASLSLRRCIRAIRENPRKSAAKKFLCRRRLHDRLILRVPINFPPRPIRFRRHHARHGMRKAVFHGAMRLLPRAHAFEPVRHMLE